MFKQKNSFLLAVIATLVLSACSTAPKEQTILSTTKEILLRGTGSVREVVRTDTVVVKEQQVTIIAPSEELLKTCTVPTPPDRTKYLTSEPQKKEELLSFYVKDLLKSISVCNNTIISIRNYIREKSLIETSATK